MLAILFMVISGSGILISFLSFCLESGLTTWQISSLAGLRPLRRRLKEEEEEEEAGDSAVAGGGGTRGGGAGEEEFENSAGVTGI